MKTIMSLGMLCLIPLFLLSTAFGADKIKIGVVNIQEFQKKSKKFETTRASLEKKFGSLQQKLDKERTALLALEEDFKKQKMMLSLDAQDDKKRELDRKRRYYKYLVEDITQQMKDAEIEATKNIGKALETTVQKIGKKEGYTLILEKRTLGLVYYNSTIDITDRVIKAFDRSNP
jgi:outer membrane protein